jgi:hypothetical protein
VQLIGDFLIASGIGIYLYEIRRIFAVYPEAWFASRDGSEHSSHRYSQNLSPPLTLPSMKSVTQIPGTAIPLPILIVVNFPICRGHYSHSGTNQAVDRGSARRHNLRLNVELVQGILALVGDLVVAVVGQQHGNLNWEIWKWKIDISQ